MTFQISPCLSEELSSIEKRVGGRQAAWHLIQWRQHTQDENVGRKRFWALAISVACSFIKRKALKEEVTCQDLLHQISQCIPWRNKAYVTSKGERRGQIGRLLMYKNHQLYDTVQLSKEITCKRVLFILLFKESFHKGKWFMHVNVEWFTVESWQESEPDSIAIAYTPPKGYENHTAKSNKNNLFLLWMLAHSRP